MKPLEPLSEEELGNTALVNAHLAVASLTVAWHYVLRVEGHDTVEGQIEVALQSAYELQDRAREKPPKKGG